MMYEIFFRVPMVLPATTANRAIFTRKIHPSFIFLFFIGFILDFQRTAFLGAFIVQNLRRLFARQLVHSPPNFCHAGILTRAFEPQVLTFLRANISIDPAVAILTLPTAKRQIDRATFLLALLFLFLTDFHLHSLSL